jgi:hypothetical protein
VFVIGLHQELRSHAARLAEIHGMSQVCIIQALGKRVKKAPTRGINTLGHVRFEPRSALCEANITGAT